MSDHARVGRSGRQGYCRYQRPALALAGLSAFDSVLVRHRFVYPSICPRPYLSRALSECHEGGCSPVLAEPDVEENNYSILLEKIFEASLALESTPDRRAQMQ